MARFGCSLCISAELIRERGARTSIALAFFCIRGQFGLNQPRHAKRSTQMGGGGDNEFNVCAGRRPACYHQKTEAPRHLHIIHAGQLAVPALLRRANLVQHAQRSILRSTSTGITSARRSGQGLLVTHVSRGNSDLRRTSSGLGVGSGPSGIEVAMMSSSSLNPSREIPAQQQKVAGSRPPHPRLSGCCTICLFPMPKRAAAQNMQRRT